MAPYFYSLGMIISNRGWSENQNLTSMDLLALALSDDEKPPHKLIETVFDFSGESQKGGSK